MRQEIKAIMHRYGQMLRYPLRHWRTIIAILGLTAGTSATATLQPWPMKILVDYAFGQAVIPPLAGSFLETFNLALTPMLLVVVAAVCSLGLYALNATLETTLSWAWSAVGQSMVYELAQKLFYRLQRLSLLFHNQRTVGDSLSRLAGDTYCVYTLSSALLISPVQHLLTLGTISIVAWNLSPLLTLLSLFVAPMMGGSALVFGSRLKRRTKLNREAQSRLTSFVHQTVTAIPMIQAFGRESYNTRQFEHLAADAVVLSQRETLLKSVYGVANGTVTTIGTALVLYVGGQQVLLGAMSIGSLLVFLAYLQSIQGAFKGLFGIYGSLKSVDANIDRVLEVLDAKDGVQDAPTARPLPAHPAGGRGHVCLEKVTFGYEPNYPVLQEITLEARPGETIALVGATGAGKSTLVSLIPRFFDPWQGRVLFDGVDVRGVQLESLREQIALVLQEPFLLPLSVAQNIAYACPEASLEKIVAAAKAAKADDFIQQLPRGYDTLIGERGALLSGGQKQRLAIARALLKDAPVLILDEPTSALDAQTENLLLEALDRLIEGRTTFIIAHRLSTIQRADRIVVLEQLSIGSLLVFLSYLGSLYVPMATLAYISSSFAAAAASARRVLEVLDAKDGVQDAPAARPLPANPAGGRGHVCLEKVTFGYEPNYPVLQEITLEARPGETIALVGATGAGKTTLVSLILRFFDPWQGRVLFDGVDVQSVQLKSLREQIALVLQEPFLLPITIAENIAYGCFNASREAIVKAAQAANADTFIQRLPQGYDTVIGERGATLSGGEKQRLAIARALLKDAPVLILDEPTSALDAQTEFLLLEALERLMAGRTTFIIAHRLSTIQRANRIVVLDQGKVVEMGTHEELLAVSGYYKKLYKLHFGSTQPCDLRS